MRGTWGIRHFGSAAGDPTSYEQAGWHIVVLNGECRLVGCRPGTPQEQWLRAISERIPLVDGGVELVLSGVELVLSGDEHVYERFARMDGDGAPSRTGRRLFVVGTGGRGHYTFGTVLPTSEARNNDTFGVLKLTLHARSYDWRFLPEAGRTFSDHGSDTCQ